MAYRFGLHGGAAGVQFFWSITGNDQFGKGNRFLAPAQFYGVAVKNIEQLSDHTMHRHQRWLANYRLAKARLTLGLFDEIIVYFTETPGFTFSFQSATLPD